MRNFVLVFLVFLSIQLIVKCEEKCHAEGKCAGDELTTYTDTASEMDCLIHCKDYPGCQWYSFYPERTYCWLYSKCDTISAADCSTCSTGEVSCPLPTCSVPGGCQGTTAPDDTEFDVRTERDCWAKCVNNSQCKWYSYDRGSEVCRSFKTCKFRECPGCVRGERSCNIPEGDLTRILIATGNPVIKSVATEVISPVSPDLDCSMTNIEDFPHKGAGMGATGGLLFGSIPLICGGENEGDNVLDTCRIFMSEDGQWHHAGKLSMPRVFASSVVMDKNTLWVTGGIGINEDTSLSSEFLSLVEKVPGSKRLEVESTPGPKLPAMAYGHCLIKISPTVALMTGGEPYNDPQHDFTFSYFLFTFGPTLLEEHHLKDIVVTSGSGPVMTIGRRNHGCGMVNDNLVVVAGGKAGSVESYLDSTEFWRLGSPGWIKGPKLPDKIGFATGVTNQDASAFLLVGGINHEGPTGAVYRMDCLGDYQTGTEDCEWNTLYEKGSLFKRSSVVAMLIPHEMTNCTMTMQAEG